MVFSERLYPSPVMLVVAGVFSASLGLIAVPFSPALAWVIALVAAIAVPAVLYLASPRIRVTESAGERHLSCGGAHISSRYLGQTRLVDEAGLRERLRAEQEGKYWICYSPSVKRAVSLEIIDEADPHEAWLICSRKPRELARALGAPRASSSS